MNMKHFVKLSKVSIFVLVVGTMSISMVGQVSADTFNRNRIIDDTVFDNSNAMNANTIDTFLNRFPQSCISPGSGFQARIPSGYSPTGGYTYGAYGSAGDVIDASAKIYGLNPQVLLTTLEKEQSLVTGRNSSSYCAPGNDNNHKYASAVGYGCPDSGTSYSYSNLDLYRRNGVTQSSVGPTCVNSAIKAGFSQQVIRAAWLLKFGQQRAKGNIGWGVQTGSWNNSDDPQSCYGGPMTQGTFQRCPSGATVYYDGYTTIDGNPVRMESGASAALYWYTPHFHGNENFFSLFTGWFGPALTDAYKWQNEGQYVYTDETKTVGASTVGLLPGQRVYVGFKARNTGSSSWTSSGTNPVYAGTVRPLDRASTFCDSSWFSCNRPVRMLEANVAPGELGTFEFWYKAPQAVGVYNEYFGLVVTGQAWMPDIGLNFRTTVSPPTYTWQPAGQYAYTDETKTAGRGTSNLMPGDRVFVGIKARNTGNMAWNKSGANTVLLGTNRPIDRGSAYYDTTWLSRTRPAQLVEATVAPGQIGTFEFWMKASASGSFSEFFTPVVEGVTWMNDAGVNFAMQTPQPRYSWQFLDQYAYVDQTKTVGKGTTNMLRGDRVYVGFKAKNTGNISWRNNGPNPVNIGMTHPLDRLSAFFDGTWLGQNRPAHMLEAEVAPGQTGTFEFWMKAPNQPGTYLEHYSLVAEGAAWLNDPNLNFYMSVQ